MKKNKKKDNSFINSKACTKLLLLICIFLIGCIICKNNISYRSKIYDKLYKDNISFVGVKNFYNKYFGGIIPLDNIIKEDNTKMVFIESGMVIFNGEKEGYGNTIIIEGLNGIDIWYSNIVNSNVKLYDYIEEGSFLGEVNKELYLVFCQNGKYITYEKYLEFN